MTSRKRQLSFLQSTAAGEQKRRVLSSDVIPQTAEQIWPISRELQSTRNVLPSCDRDIKSEHASLIEDDAESRVQNTNLPEQLPNVRPQWQRKNPASSQRKIEICYGALFGSKAAWVKMFDLDKSFFLAALKDRQALQRYCVSSRDGYYALLSPDGRDFAILDNRSYKALNATQAFESVRFQAVIQRTDSKMQATAVEPTHKVDHAADVSINVYGSFDLMRPVGSALARFGKALQHPDCVDPGIDYKNPHFFHIPGQETDLNSLVKPTDTSQEMKARISLEIGQIIDSLDAIDFEYEMPTSQGILTPLLSHQKSALKFIRWRESHLLETSLWRRTDESKGCEFANEITGMRENAQPEIAAGGIIADKMGLGKTLTMLSAIVHSRDDAFCFETLYSPLLKCEDSLCSSRATLVVVPSTQVMEVWSSEIDRHLAKGLLHTVKFHGNRRETDPRVLGATDVVLTTFSTLMKDYQNKKVLYHIAWFRTILDEAHWVRNQETVQFRAVNTLHADRRWCLTGTPFHNKLEDWGALVRFLKIDPFHGKSAKAMFSRYIIDPLFSDDDDPCRNFRKVLRLICLRRKEQDHSKLVARYETARVELRPAERALYEKVIDQARTDADLLASSSTNSSAQKYIKTVTLILQLRMICVLGSSWDGLKVSNTGLVAGHVTPQYQIGDEYTQGCDVCQDKESLILLKGMTFCPGCSQILRGSGARSPSGNLHLPQSSGISSSLPISADTEAGFLKNESSTTAGDQQPLDCEGSSSERCSSKISAVVQNICQNINHSKSIVFSYWKKPLDVLGEMLSLQMISFVRIDGNVTFSERQRQLEAFRERPEVSTLLMTFSTGAVGLNLSCANYIHIVEPQWNPTIEEQAIARALRLGQTREVTVIRYIVENSVEKNILEFQKRKQQLSSLAFDEDQQKSLSDKLQVWHDCSVCC
ncbi:hypothetical protein EV356DRAFT_46167 [Viridothelium virens]|uniref:Uncharacterized protein n=1 Tax=Viridothelium virens TaxID=1048519 RepID=A0A6A6GT42_VIRVR|nr:hypothetical protein EV356DRAFT_46167 [Viridothelium virens]